LPSNQINALLVGSDGTIWAATAAGLAWSRNNGENWHFVRGRDYGDKVWGLLAGAPRGWKSLPRARFGELFPEDDIALLHEDSGGMLWVGTRSLGCVAVNPKAFYRGAPKSDSLTSQQRFLEAMANTTRYHGTKTDQVTAMTPLPDGKVMIASRWGSLETMEHPDISANVKTTVSVKKTEQAAQFPSPYPVKPAEQRGIASMGTANSRVAVLADDYTTG
jgi:hypothetical protein